MYGQIGKILIYLNTYFNSTFMKPEIYYLDQIQEALKDVDPVPAIEEGFVSYSKGNVVVPPVGEMIFYDPPV